MKRSPLKRTSPLRAKSPMKHRRSARARAKEFSLTVRQTVLERSQGICELCHQRPIAHLHHAVYRSQGGTGDLSNCLGVCYVCHEACHATRAMRDHAVIVARELAERDECYGAKASDKGIGFTV